MSKRFGIEGEMIYCVNDDGSVTNIALIDLDDGNIRPVDKETWYSELEREIEDLKIVQDNYSKLLSLVTDTNMQIISTKSALSDLISATNKGLLHKISRNKNLNMISIMCIIIFVGVSVFTIIGDFFPNLAPLYWYII